MSAPTPQQFTDIHAKALAMNLEASCYGTFAEIGAGQEVARWFLSAGAASGTVAQVRPLRLGAKPQGAATPGRSEEASKFPPSALVNSAVDRYSYIFPLSRPE